MNFMATALTMAAGIVVWAAHFLAIYGITGLACARGWSHVVVPAVSVSTALAVALLVVVLRHGWSRRGEFEPWFTAATAAFALVAVLWEAMPALVVEPCA